MADDTRQRIHRAVERVQRRYEGHGRLFRIAWVVAGVFVLAAGLVLMFTPGPALVVIPVGLAMLAAAFRPMARLVDASVERGLDLRDAAQRHPGAARTAAGLGFLAAAGVAYLWLR